jgi:hypothetical protein
MQSRSPRRIAILTIGDDLHALLVQKTLRERALGVECQVVETNRLFAGDGLEWWADDRNPCVVEDREGVLVDVAALDLVWWRRVNYPQSVLADCDDAATGDLVRNDWNAALLGTFLTRFRGTWISHPTRTALAENKLVQLTAARQAGLTIPQTLVSQRPETIRRFCSQEDFAAVVKPVKGTHKTGLLTQRVRPGHLADDESLKLSPAIYQECIPGSRHIRALCMGTSTTAVAIDSHDLDWRRNLDVPMSKFEIDASTRSKLAHVLQILGIEMGVFDLKLTDDGEVVWFEVNPQGQFLFAEGTCGVDHTTPFCNFLLDRLGLPSLSERESLESECA